MLVLCAQVLLEKWNLEPAQGLGELEDARRSRLERERVKKAKERARGEACLIWQLATQLVEEEAVLHRELNKKKDRIKAKLAIAARMASKDGSANGAGGNRNSANAWTAAQTVKKIKFSGDSILASIGL